MKRKHIALLLSCDYFAEERAASGEGLSQSREQRLKNVRDIGHLEANMSNK